MSYSIYFKINNTKFLGYQKTSILISRYGYKMAENKYKPMQIKILDIDKFVKSKGLPRVKSIKKLSTNKTLDENGLFSEKIFGRLGSTDRMNNMAYIELNTYCLQPYICIALERMSAEFVRTMMGTLQWKVEGSKIKRCDEGEEGMTGLPFIYKYFDEVIKELIKDTGSKTRDSNLKLLKSHTKEELFTSKWIIIPAGFRDINSIDIETRGKSDYDEINDYYSKMIDISNRLDQTNELGLDIIDDKLCYQMQQCINDIYRHLIEKKLAKKNGLIQRSALAKTISYSAGNVISLPKLTRKSYDIEDSNNIPMGYIGIPAVQLVDIFYPFYLHRMKEVLTFDERIFNIIKGLVHAKDTYSMDEVIEKFANSIKVDRKLMLADMEYNDEKYSITVNGKERVLKTLDFLKNDIIDPIIIDKYVTGTRFPFDNGMSQQYLKPKAITVENVEQVTDDHGIKYELADSDILLLSFQPSVFSLQGWGGDFDGDTIAVTALFSDEANKAIEEKAWTRVRPLNAMGKGKYDIGNELLIGLYSLTED